MKPADPWGWGGRGWALVTIVANLGCVSAVPLLAAFGAGPVREVALTAVRAQGVVFFAAVVACLAWLRGAYDRALFVRPTEALELRKTFLGIRFEHWFFVPIMCFFVPYRAIATLDAELEPGPLPSPAETPAGSPRTIGRWDELAGDGAPPPAPIAAWWAFWVMRVPFSFVASHGPVGAIASLLVSTVAWTLTFLVVWRISARLDEVIRRVKARAFA